MEIHRPIGHRFIVLLLRFFTRMEIMISLPQVSEDATVHVFDYVAGADILHVEVLHKGAADGLLIGDAWVCVTLPSCF
jgi:hypothetical protein